MALALHSCRFWRPFDYPSMNLKQLPTLLHSRNTSITACDLTNPIAFINRSTPFTQRNNPAQEITATDSAATLLHSQEKDTTTETRSEKKTPEETQDKFKTEQ